MAFAYLWARIAKVAQEQRAANGNRGGDKAAFYQAEAGANPKPGR